MVLSGAENLGGFIAKKWGHDIGRGHFLGEREEVDWQLCRRICTEWFLNHHNIHLRRFYDTYHSHPLSIVKGLHFAGLTDCAWTPDGLNLAVSSTYGYLSTISFQKGELGTVYSDPARMTTTAGRNSQSVGAAIHSSVPEGTTRVTIVPPCDPGQSATLVAPPSKKAKFTPQDECDSPTRIVESTNQTSLKNEKQEQAVSKTDESILQQCGTKRDNDDKNEGNIEKEVVGGVTKLSIDNEMPKKKKKRVQPTLLSCGN